MNDVETGREFFAEHAPDARAIADPDRVLYDAFGVKRGGLGQLLGLSVVRRGFAARSRGFSRGTVQGDPRVMPGLVLVDDRHVVWEHRYAHAGDNPDVSLVPRVAGES